MTKQGKQTGRVLRVVVCAIVVGAMVILAGCKKQPSGQADTERPGGPGESGPVSESPDESGRTDVESPADSKMSLNDVINTARTWYPTFTSWFGKTSPDFTLADITGKEHTLSGYRGKNVMVILWAIRCRPCQMEVPDFIELRNTVGEDKLAMLAISPENPTLLEGFVAQQKINYTVVSSPGTMPMPYSLVQYVPSTFFIDQEGKIKLAVTGMVPVDEIKAIFQAR